jgi:hypothetical protein
LTQRAHVPTLGVEQELDTGLSKAGLGIAILWVAFSQSLGTALVVLSRVELEEETCLGNQFLHSLHKRGLDRHCRFQLQRLPLLSLLLLVLWFLCP